MILAHQFYEIDVLDKDVKQAKIPQWMGFVKGFD